MFSSNGQMSYRSRSRRFVCLGAVMLLHIAAINMLHPKRNSMFATPNIRDSLQYIAVIEPNRNFATRKPIAHKPAKLSTPGQPARVFLLAPEQPKSESTVQLDLDMLRANAVQHELNRARSQIEIHNEKSLRNKSLEARLERGANEAQHSDCRNAYATNGLFAPLMITADLLRDKGCKF